MNGYPRTYRPAPFWMGFLLGMSPISCWVLAMSLMRYPWHGGRPESGGLAILVSILAMAGLYCILTAVRSKGHG